MVYKPLAGGVPSYAQGTNPWAGTFVPRRNFYATPSGTGSGKSATDPTNITDVQTIARGGDRIWVSGTFTGKTSIGPIGGVSADNPVEFRSKPGQTAKFEVLKSSCPYAWFRELQINDAAGVTPLDEESFDPTAIGNRLINCYVNENLYRHGPKATNQGVHYGNIVCKNAIQRTDVLLGAGAYGTYSQNLWTSGYWYIVNCMFMDHALLDRGNAYNLNLYSAGNSSVQGVWLQNNIIANMLGVDEWLVNQAQNVIGSSSEVAAGTLEHHNHLISNYWYKSTPNLGLSHPCVWEIKNNVFARNQWSLLHNELWGTGDDEFDPVDYPAHDVQNNRFLFHKLGHFHVVLRTARRKDGTTQKNAVDCLLPSTVVWDNNEYTTPFRAHYEMRGNAALAIEGLATWRTQTAADGKEFDTNSTEIADPTGTEAYFILNEYNDQYDQRGHLAVYNWDLAASVSVDLGELLSNGDGYEIYTYSDALGTPVASGTYNGVIASIPMAGAEFGAYLVKKVL